MEQGAEVATHDQLYDAWRAGLDWCNAGWLADGSVKYPIVNPRGPCGGTNNGPGLRSYGRQDKQSLYDVFCYASALKGKAFDCIGLLDYTSLSLAVPVLTLCLLCLQDVFIGWFNPST